MQPSQPLYEDERIETISPYLLWGIWLMWLPFLFQPAAALIQMSPSWQKIVTAIGLLLFIAAYLWASWQEACYLTRTPLTTDPVRRAWLPVLSLLVLSIILPFIQFAWGLGGVIYTSAVIAGRLKVRQAILAFAGLILLTLVLGVLTASPWSTIALMLFLTPAVGSMVAVFGHAFRTNVQLRLARREIARLAVSEERLRFARDLHDLLGHTLSLITIKSELAGQLIPEDPERALNEIRDIESSARTALQEVREAVTGYRRSSLENELQRIQELLSAANVQATVQKQVENLPASLDALLAWVVREGVTNVLRHSRATSCVTSLTQRLDEVRLTIINDGAEGQFQQAVILGNGLRGINERVAALNGRCEVGPVEDGSFVLTVSLPLRSTQSSRRLASPTKKGKAE